MSQPLPLPLPVRLALQQILNGVLSLDPDIISRLQSMNGRTLAVVVTPPGWRIVLSIVDDRLLISSDEDGAVDTTLTGGPGDFLSLLRSNDALFSGAVRVEGDLGVAQGLRSIFARLDLDWASTLEPLVGPTLTHQIERAFQGGTDWVRRSGSSLRSDSRDYLSEELRVVPTRVEAQQQFDEIDEARAHLDRLQRRIERLESKSADTPQ